MTTDEPETESAVFAPVPLDDGLSIIPIEVFDAALAATPFLPSLPPPPPPDQLTRWTWTMTLAEARNVFGKKLAKSTLPILHCGKVTACEDTAFLSHTDLSMGFRRRLPGTGWVEANSSDLSANAHMLLPLAGIQDALKARGAGNTSVTLALNG